MEKTYNSLLVVWNLVLTAAVVFLIYKYMQKPGGTRPESREGGVEAPELVFVNTDTLLSYYPYYDALNEAFKQKQDSLEKVITDRASGLEREIQQYQENAGALTPQQRQETEEKLYKRQQGLMAFREQALGKLSEDEEDMMMQLHADLAREIREYNHGQHLFIFGYQRSSGILFADSTLDITREVIEALKE